MNTLKGVWLPVVTPFYNNKIDYKSYERLINHYADKGIAGFIPNGTTGESPTIEEEELEEFLEKTLEFNNNRLPVYFGLGGNSTHKVLKQIKIVEKYKVAGILSVSPYYSRPSQAGIYEHFKAIADSTDLNIILYNIPYRTGRNIENETLFKLAELSNIRGVKDSCGNINQSMELLFNSPDHFSVLTGEDTLFYLNMILGGDGGILASSHFQTEKFVSIMDSIDRNDHQTALKTWKEMETFISLLFKEPNPAPIKYCLAQKGLIDSASLRLPMTEISDSLKQKLDKYL